MAGLFSGLVEECLLAALRTVTGDLKQIEAIEELHISQSESLYLSGDWAGKTS